MRAPSLPYVLVKSSRLNLLLDDERLDLNRRNDQLFTVGGDECQWVDFKTATQKGLRAGVDALINGTPVQPDARNLEEQKRLNARKGRLALVFGLGSAGEAYLAVSGVKKLTTTAHAPPPSLSQTAPLPSKSELFIGVGMNLTFCVIAGLNAARLCREFRAAGKAIEERQHQIRTISRQLLGFAQIGLDRFTHRRNNNSRPSSPSVD